MAYKLNEIDLVHVDKKKWKHIMTEYKKKLKCHLFWMYNSANSQNNQSES